MSLIIGMVEINVSPLPILPNIPAKFLNVLARLLDASVNVSPSLKTRSKYLVLAIS